MPEFETLAAELGDGMRKLAAASAACAAEIVRLKLQLKTDTAELEKRLGAVWDAVAAYATDHRAELLKPGRKSAAIAAGVIGWRTGAPTVTFQADEEAIIDLIQAAGFAHFLREKTEIDKSAILADPALAARIQGILITQAERLIFKPLDLDTEISKAVKVAPAEAAEAA